MSNDPLASIRQAGTSGPNFDIDNAVVLAELTRWQSLCTFTVTAARGDGADIEFTTLPKDMDAFAQDLYKFCPDLVDQGTGCLHEMLEAMEEMGEEPSPSMLELAEGIDFSDENYGVEVLKREILQKKSVSLWWD
jgi:hypothetical protein